MSEKTDQNAVSPENTKDAAQGKKWEKLAEAAADSEAVAKEQEAHQAAVETQPEAIEVPSHEELIAKINELELNQDKMVRLLAEKENSLRRANAEIEKANKFAVAKLTQDLLAVLDSLELSLQAIAADKEELKSFREGIEMTLKMFLSTLEKYGIKMIHPLNEQFDPNFHEAISVQEHPEAPSGKVLTVLQKGVILHERLIRPATVIIAK